MGRNAYLEEDVIGPIAELFEDSSDVVRKFAHQAIEMVAEVAIGAQGVVDGNLVPILVAKLNDETDEIKVPLKYPLTKQLA